jgi:hypothetical protein
MLDEVCHSPHTPLRCSFTLPRDPPTCGTPTSPLEDFSAWSHYAGGDPNGTRDCTTWFLSGNHAAGTGAVSLHQDVANPRARSSCSRNSVADPRLRGSHHDPRSVRAGLGGREVGGVRDCCRYSVRSPPIPRHQPGAGSPARLISPPIEARMVEGWQRKCDRTQAAPACAARRGSIPEHNTHREHTA